MGTAVKTRKNLPVELCKELLVAVKKRFDKNMHHHQSIDLAGVQVKKYCYYLLSVVVHAKTQRRRRK